MINLTEESRRVLETLKDLNWFRDVGHAIDDNAVPRVVSWKEAIDLCGTKRYGNIQMEAANQLREKLFLEYRHRYDKVWNDLVAAIKKLWMPTSRKKIAAIERALVLKKHRGVKEPLVATVNWDILMACMELEYADIIPPRFFTHSLKWYLAGHFPCGWQGDFPKGCLVVF